MPTPVLAGGQTGAGEFPRVEGVFDTFHGMAEAEKPNVSKDRNALMAEMVRLITKMGPSISEISKRLGISVTAGRLRYKKLLNMGLAVEGVATEERLGLQRVVAIVDFAKEFEQHAERVLKAMSRSHYVEGYGKMVPSGSYEVHAGVPREHEAEWTQLIGTLKQKGVFRSVETFAFDTFRDAPMRTDRFDFESCTWECDWSDTQNPDAEPVVYRLPSKQKFDKIDLNILQNLQLDATRSFEEIASCADVDTKRMVWHLRNHIVRRGLLSGYRVNWTSFQSDNDRQQQMLSNPLQPAGEIRKYVLFHLLVKDVTPPERSRLVNHIRSVPFVLEEGVGSHYYAQMAFPTQMVSEGLAFLGKAVEPVIKKSNWYIVDSSHRAKFTIRPNLYDQEHARWKFDFQRMLNALDSLLPQSVSARGMG